MEYEIENNEITITGYFGNEKVITVPREIGGTPVTKIMTNVFKDSFIKEVLVPDTIMELGKDAIATGIKCTFYKGTLTPDAPPETISPIGTESPEESSTDSGKPEIMIEVIDPTDIEKDKNSGNDEGTLELPTNPEPVEDGKEEASGKMGTGAWVAIIGALSAALIALVIALKRKATKG